MKAFALSLLLAFAAPIAAQTQTPATQPPSQETPPAPHKPLNLSLDPADQPRSGSRITFEPREDKKPPAESTLPGMGGERTRAWEPPSDKIFPPDTAPKMR